MKAKAAFIVGVGVGYVFGTAAGRQRFERMKARANEVWHSDQVQSTVDDLQTRASELAKNQGSVLVEKVATTVSEGVRSTFGFGNDAERNATDGDAAAGSEDVPQPPNSPYGS